MKQKSTPVILVFFALIFFLLALSFSPGCVQSGNASPLNVTIHSAYKTTELAGQIPKPGTVFVVVNMTVENRGDKTYRFDNTSAIITNGRMVNERMFARITRHGYWGPIPPHAKRTGDIIFGASKDTEDFTLTFLYNDGQDSFDQQIGSIPMRSVSSYQVSSQNTGNTAKVSEDSGSLNVTIHSAIKTMQIQGSRPKTGNIFVVLNMTIENLAGTDYALNEKTVTITGGGPLTQKLYDVLTNPLHWGSIPAHEKRTGRSYSGSVKPRRISPSASLTMPET